MHTQHSPLIITGAGQRLGLAAALSLHNEGFNVVCSYRTPRPGIKLLTEAGIECIQADFSNEAGVNAFIQLVCQRYNTIRGIIHNASEWQPDQHEGGYELIEKLLQVHVKAPYLINQALQAQLKRYVTSHPQFEISEANPMADVIHMTDHSVDYGSASHIAYSASKAALANLTVCYAKKLAPYVKVNSIAPSLLMFNKDDSEKYRQLAKSKTLLPPNPGAEEGVNAIRYLLSSRYLTGQTIALNGGRHLATEAINSTALT